jgi:hypothetical protein
MKTNLDRAGCSSRAVAHHHSNRTWKSIHNQLKLSIAVHVLQHQNDLAQTYIIMDLASRVHVTNIEVMASFETAAWYSSNSNMVHHQSHIHHHLSTNQINNSMV